MTIQGGTGTILSKGLQIADYCKLNNRSLYFNKFFITDQVALTYEDMTDPTGTYNNMTMEELETALAANIVHPGKDLSIHDNGNYLVNGDTTIIPIVLPVGVGDIPSDADFRHIYLTAKDSEVDVILNVDDTTGWTAGDTITGASGATGDVVKVYAAANKVYLKNVVGIYVDGESVTNGVTPHTLTDFNTDIEVVVSSVTGFSAGDTVTDTVNGGTGTIYDIDIPGLKIYIKNSESEFDTGSSNLTNGSATASISSVSEYHAFFAFWNGFLAYDDSKALNDPSGIVTIPYIANSESNNIRLNLRQTSGLPDLTQFVDTRAVEITEHDNDGNAHVGSCLHLSGDNSPVADIDWDNNKITNLATATTLGDAIPHGQLSTVSSDSQVFGNYTNTQNYLNSLPKILNHDITVEITADATFEVNTITIEGFMGKGRLLFQQDAGTPQLKKILVRDCTAEIQIKGLLINPNQTSGCIEVYNSNNVYIQDCRFTGANSYGIVFATESSKVRLITPIILDTVTNLRGVYATRNSIIECSGWTQSNKNAISGYVFSSYYNAVIKKPTGVDPVVTPSEIARTSNSVYEYTKEGGVIIGMYGLNSSHSGVSRNDQVFVETDEALDVLTDYFKLIGPFVPTNTTITVLFDGASFTQTETANIIDWYGGGKITFDSLSGAPVTIDKDGDSYFYFRNCDIELSFDDFVFNGGAITDNIIEFRDCKRKIDFSDCEFTYNGSIYSGIEATNCHLIELNTCEFDGFYEMLYLTNTRIIINALTHGGTNQPNRFARVYGGSKIIVNSSFAAENFRPSSIYFDIDDESELKWDSPGSLIFDNTWTSAQIQILINAIPKYLKEDETVLFSFAAGTYNFTTALSFNNFYGGGVFTIDGAGAGSTIFDCNFDDDCIKIWRNKNGVINIQDITVDCYNTDNACVYVANTNSKVIILNSEFSSTVSQENYGVLVSSSQNVNIRTCEFNDLAESMTTSTSTDYGTTLIHSYNNTSTTNCNIAVKVDSGDVIYCYGTVPDANTTKFYAAPGSQIILDETAHYNQLSIDNTWTIAEMNEYINALPKYIPFGDRVLITFSNGLYSYVADEAIYFRGFFGEGLLRVGASGYDPALHDFSDFGGGASGVAFQIQQGNMGLTDGVQGSLIFHNCKCYTQINNMQINAAGAFGGCVAFQSCENMYLAGCLFLSNNANQANVVISKSEVIAENNRSSSAPLAVSEVKNTSQVFFKEFRRSTETPGIITNRFRVNNGSTLGHDTTPAIAVADVIAGDSEFRD